MKTLIIILPFCLLLFCGGCKWLEPKPQLPAATQEGKGTFGCLVNGELMLPSRTFASSGVHAEFQYSKNKDTIGVNIYADNGEEGITISFYDSPTLQVNKTYSLVPSATAKFYVQYNRNCRYEHLIKGQIKLSRFDKINQIISGTFEFTISDPSCRDTIQVTEGRFDI